MSNNNDNFVLYERTSRLYLFDITEQREATDACFSEASQHHASRQRRGPMGTWTTSNQE